jgi:hypothetical protein
MTSWSILNFCGFASGAEVQSRSLCLPWGKAKGCSSDPEAAKLRRVAFICAVLASGVPAAAQLIVFDPTEYSEIVQQFQQLVQTYQQIRAQYLLLVEQAQMLPVDMNGRYRSLATPWLPFAAADAYGTTDGWILTANTGHEAVAGFTQATQPLGVYGTGLTSLSAEEASRIRARYDRIQLEDASLSHGLEALGFLRGHQMSVEAAIRNLEDDAYATEPDRNTQIAVLNKINATGVTNVRLSKDANNVLVSVLEQQILTETERREAIVQGINAHIAFVLEARTLLQRTTSQTTTALTTFRIP